jgi:signal transduction histidine kinase
MNFNGVEMERKRIANDIHDQVGYNIMQVKNALHEATKKATTFTKALKARRYLQISLVINIL